MSLVQIKKEQLFHNFEQDGFGKLNRNDLPDNTVTTFTKIALPVLYVVTFVDNHPEPDFISKEQAMTTYLENNLNQYHCTHLVHVNIIVTEQQGLRALFPYIPGEKTIHVTWFLNPVNQQINIPDGQPDKILNLRQILQHTDDSSLLDEKNKERSIAYSARKPLVTYCLIIINVVLFAYSLMQNEDFLYQFSSNRIQILSHKEYYRLFTSMFFHDGLQHIGYNALTLYIFGSRTEKFFGPAPFLILYVFSGIGGCLLSLYFQPAYVYSLGASGAICGLVTAFFLITITQKHIAFDLDSMTIILYIIITIGTGFMIPNVDYYGHFGGFLTGLAIGALYLFVGKKKNLNNGG